MAWKKRRSASSRVSCASAGCAGRTLKLMVHSANATRCVIPMGQLPRAAFALGQRLRKAGTGTGCGEPCPYFREGSSTAQRTGPTTGSQSLDQRVYLVLAYEPGWLIQLHADPAHDRGRVR